MVSLLDRWLKRYRYDNTRRYKRLPAVWPVKFTVIFCAENPDSVRMKNISAGGVALVSKKGLPMETCLRLEILVVPAQRTIQAVGKVVRSAPQKGAGFELGISFVEIDPKDRALLNEAIDRFYLDENSPSPRKSWWRKIP